MMNNAITITEADHEGLTNLHVNLPAGPGSYGTVNATLPSGVTIGSRVTVSIRQADPDGEMGWVSPAQVNWSAHGDSSVADAVAYANLIRIAAAIVS